MSSSNIESDFNQLANSYISLCNFLEKVLQSSQKNAVDKIRNRLNTEKGKEIYIKISCLIKRSMNVEENARLLAADILSKTKEEQNKALTELVASAEQDEFNIPLVQRTLDLLKDLLKMTNEL